MLFHLLLPLTLSYVTFWLGYARLGLLAVNRLGDYSYGLYIYAFPVQQMVAQWSGGGTPLGNIALSLPLALVPAVLSWHLIEKPALSFKPARATTGPASAPRNTAGAP